MKLLEKTLSPIYLFCTLLICFASTTFAQVETQINGTITDAKSNEPLIGVSIIQKGTTNGTVTDFEGNFILSNVPRGATLQISYVGYEPIEIDITNQNKNLSIQLKESQIALEEVVVIGYGAVKRKDVTTAIATVSTKDIDQRPLVSAAQAIQGKAAGVSVIQPNGTPGAEMSIRVRGTTSFNGSNDPLYVVDGVPVDNINFLSPNDIENIQILKDASSAAIYGSRAANGVILVNTKAGGDREAKITFNTQLSLNNVVKTMESLNTQQYKELQDEIGMITLPDGLTDKTDWFNEAYSTGNRQNYQLSISDGNEKMNYFISGGYVNEKGVLNTAYYKRYNFRLNLDSKVRKWLTLNANISYSDSEKNGLQTGLGANRGGVVLSVINTPTYAPIWNPDNPDQYYNNFYGIGNINNPLENMARNENDRDKENRLIASGSFLITFMPDLTLKSSFTLDRRHGLKTTFLDPIATSWGRNQFGEGSDNRNSNTVLTFDNILSYNKSFMKNKIEAMVGTSWTDSDYRNSWINGSHYRNADIQTLNAANKISWNNTGSGASEWGILSYFGRVAYNYDSKYLLTVNMRIDGSSKLHPNHRWGTFPSASAAWRISSEDFMKDLEWLDDLKIRGGWGKTGNQSGINDYAYLQRYSINRTEWFITGQENALASISQANLRTPDLKWETTAQLNLGIDLTAFSNRLMVAIDYYHKKTKDMLMKVTLPSGAAASNTITRNEGEMTNRGFEISISTVNLQGALAWNTDFNLSFNRNKLDRLDLQKIYNDAKTSDVINETVVRNEPGRALGGFYGYIADGVDPETGEMIYRDLNGDNKISSTDRTYIGDPNPDFTYGMTNVFSWKNLNLSIFIQGSYGNDVFNASRIETEGMYDGKNQSTRVLKRWRIPGQITDVPKAGFDIKNSTYFIEDGSFLRVKDISLSYDLRLEKLKKIGITRLQPYFTVSNLLTWTNYSGMDPEVNQWGNSGSVQGIDWGTYPHSKSFVFGVNVEF
ncbi:MAG: TonB-dependent receptor [Massilibacteroides sp.]|nr:TonB-dependent receptor [Massilibacteroides sp.]MDD4660804.1 TonB-dependent receptor [Massilibacteroides sp.]